MVVEHDDSLYPKLSILASELPDTTVSPKRLTYTRGSMESTKVMKLSEQDEWMEKRNNSIMSM